MKIVAMVLCLVLAAGVAAERAVASGKSGGSFTLPTGDTPFIGFRPGGSKSDHALFVAKAATSGGTFKDNGGGLSFSNASGTEQVTNADPAAVGTSADPNDPSTALNDAEFVHSVHGNYWMLAQAKGDTTPYMVKKSSTGGHTITSAGGVTIKTTLPIKYAKKT